MLRASMTDLIERFRYLGNASENDLFDGVVFWSEDQLQEILDSHRTYVQIPVTTVNKADTLHRLDIKPQYKMAEGEFTVYDTNGNEVSDTFTYSLMDNHITTATAQDSLDYVEGWVYSLFGSLIELYDRKAAQREFYTRTKSGNNTLHLEQEYHHCIARRDYYRNKLIRAVDTRRPGRWRT